MFALNFATTYLFEFLVLIEVARNDVKSKIYPHVHKYYANNIIVMKVLNPREHSPTHQKNFPNPFMTLLFPLSPKIESIQNQVGIINISKLCT
jgi:hypothetical protein